MTSSAVAFADPGRRFDDAVEEPQARLAVVCGVLNAAHAELVGLIGEALERRLWEQSGVMSPEHWLQWQAGVSRSRAGDLVAIARRRTELPACAEAFAAGELAVDQMAVIARHARAHNDAEVRDFAKAATVSQLARGLAAFADVTAAEQEPHDTVSCSVTDSRFELRADGPVTEGAIIRHALQDARDALFRAGAHDVTDRAALIEICTRSLDTNESPARRERYRTIVHLDTEGAWLNAGAHVPDGMWRHIACDGTIQPVWTSAGLPINLGRATRAMPERVRRVVLDRNRTCRHPGCSSSHRLEVHHLVHWADGGTTDTANLAALCAKHHRRHHLGDFTVTGDADRAPGLEFRHRHGWIINPGPCPVPPTEPPPEPAKPYQHPTGETFHGKWFDLSAPPDTG